MNQDIEAINENINTEEEDTLSNRYLSFLIDKQSYALELKDIVEIIGIQNITEIPNIKSYIEGVINLRGSIVPIINIRKRFKKELKDFDEKTCIIIINTEQAEIGLIVDEVSEVLNIDEELLSPKPVTHKGSESRFIRNIARVNQEVKIVLSAEALLYD